MYYKNITLVIFLALVLALLATAAFPTPTSGLILMLLIGAIIVIQTIAVLKGPKTKDIPSNDQWYEHH